MNLNLSKNTPVIESIKTNQKNSNGLNSNSAINYNDSYSSPSQITVYDTKDFDNFLLKICKSNKNKKESTEKIKKEILFADESTNKILCKSSITLKISLLDSHMNIIFKDSLLKNDSVNNFVCSSKMNMQSKINNVQDFNFTELNNKYVNFSNKHIDDLFKSENIFDNSFLKENGNFSKKKDFTENKNKKENTNLIESSILQRKNVKMINTINTNDSVNIEGNKITIESSKMKKGKDQDRCSLLNNFEIHSIINKNKNIRYLNTEIVNPSRIQSEDSTANLMNNKRIEEKFNFKVSLQTPESMNSLNTVDRGFAFLNSNKFQNPNSKKNNNQRTLINDNLINEKEERGKMDAKYLLNDNFDNNNNIKHESCSFYYNINSSADFLKSLKANTCFRNFLCSYSLIIESNNFSIFASERDKDTINLKNENYYFTENSKSDCCDLHGIDKIDEFNNINDSIDKDSSIHRKEYNNKQLIKIIFEILLLILLFILAYSRFKFRRIFKSKIQCTSSNRKNQTKQNQRKFKINYMNNLEEFNGFFFD